MASPRTRTHYISHIDLRGDGRIVLYKRADHDTPSWTVRIKIPWVKGFVVKSTKTRDDFEARRFAEDLYYQLEGRARRGESLKAPTLKKVFADWSRSLSSESRSKKYTDGNVRRLELWAVRYLGDHRIDLVNNDVLAQYADWRANQSPPPAISTLRNERTALNDLFRFARRKGYVRDVPEIRLKSIRPNPRPDIPEAEWDRLCAYLDQYVNKARDRRRRRERLYLQQYILILANTGVRVGEARRLKWRDVSETRTLTGELRLVLTVRGKTGEREVVCNEGVEDYLDRLRTFRTDELGEEPSPEEFVFCHRDGSAIGSFKTGFQRVLREAGVLYGSDGKRRVPYSLRHTYATMRITEGVSVFQLAANMGTSVEMIEQFYGKKRVRDPKMATEIAKRARPYSSTSPPSLRGLTLVSLTR